METVTVPGAPATVSVDSRCSPLHSLLAERGTVALDEMFAAATSRMAAIATFLALLEILKRGEIRVEPEATGVLMMSIGRGSQVAAGSEDETGK